MRVACAPDLPAGTRLCTSVLRLLDPSRLRLLALCSVDQSCPQGWQVRRSFDPARVPHRLTLRIQLGGDDGAPAPPSRPRCLWFEMPVSVLAPPSI